jgi:hypothetical protein
MTAKILSMPATDWRFIMMVRWGGGQQRLLHGAKQKKNGTATPQRWLVQGITLPMARVLYA